MLNSGKKMRTLRDKKNNILTFMLSEKKILNETKNHNTPCKLNGWSLIQHSLKSRDTKDHFRWVKVPGTIPY